MQGIATAAFWSAGSLTRSQEESGFKPNDDELVAASRAGSAEAFEKLVLRYRRMITRIGGRFFPRIEDAEDIAQETFLKAYLNLEKLRAGVPLRNWLVRIAVNLCLDRLRHMKSRPEQPISQFVTEDGQWLDRRSYLPAGVTAASEEHQIEAESLLRVLLPRISEKDQVLLHLLYGEGMTVSEVADLMGWSEVNVRVRAFRTRLSLRRAFDELDQKPRRESHG